VTRTAANALRCLGAVATIVVGAVHLQQYADFIHDVPTICVLFVLNGAGAGVTVILLGTRRAMLGAVAGIALSAGALVSIAIAMGSSGLFDYREPMFRTPVTIAVIAEAAAIILLLSYLIVARLPARKRLDWSAH